MRPGEGPLTEARAGAQSGGGGNYFLCLSVTFDSRAATRAIRQSRRSTGQELCDVFWPGIRARYWGRLSVTVSRGALSTIDACASGRRPGSSSSVASADAVERVGQCAARVSLEFRQHQRAAHFAKAAARARRRLIERDKLLAG